jgi:hypothetical protein
MKRAPRSRQRHDLYAKYHDYDSEISDLLGECGMQPFPYKLRHIYSFMPFGNGHKKNKQASCENGGEKVDHGSGGIVPLRAA